MKRMDELLAITCNYLIYSKTANIVCKKNA